MSSISPIKVDEPWYAPKYIVAVSPVQVADAVAFNTPFTYIVVVVAVVVIA